MLVARIRVVLADLERDAYLIIENALDEPALRRRTEPRCIGSPSSASTMPSSNWSHEILPWHESGAPAGTLVWSDENVSANGIDSSAVREPARNVFHLK